MKFRSCLNSSVLVMLSACGGENTDSKVPTPGAEESLKTKALETGAQVLQDKAPLGQLNAYLNGFHFYNGNPQSQMEAHHYCGHLSEEMIQCVIFDGNDDDAKIMGVEYIVSRALFEQLPADEKHLWHSHVHEVRSGTLIAPAIPAVAERDLMSKLAGTYGKTWHTWHTPAWTPNATSGGGTEAVDRQQHLPTGIPQLMMGFVDGHPADSRLVADRDKRLDVSSQKKREERSDMEFPSIAPGADAWQQGIAPQLMLNDRASSPPTDSAHSGTH